MKESASRFLPQLYCTAKIGYTFVDENVARNLLTHISIPTVVVNQLGIAVANMGNKMSS